MDWTRADRSSMIYNTQNYCDVGIFGGISRRILGGGDDYHDEGVVNGVR